MHFEDGIVNVNMNESELEERWHGMECLMHKAKDYGGWLELEGYNAPAWVGLGAQFGE